MASRVSDAIVRDDVEGEMGASALGITASVLGGSVAAAAAVDRAAIATAATPFTTVTFNAPSAMKPVHISVHLFCCFPPI